MNTKHNILKFPCPQRAEQTSSFSAIFLKSGVNVANYLKKCCSCGQPKQNFLKYFSTQPSDFEKMSITNDVCLLLGANDVNSPSLPIRDSRHDALWVRTHATACVMFHAEIMTHFVGHSGSSELGIAAFVL